MPSVDSLVELYYHLLNHYCTEYRYCNWDTEVAFNILAVKFFVSLVAQGPHTDLSYKTQWWVWIVLMRRISLSPGTTALWVTVKAHSSPVLFLTGETTTLVIQPRDGWKNELTTSPTGRWLFRTSLCPRITRGTWTMSVQEKPESLHY